MLLLNDEYFIETAVLEVKNQSLQQMLRLYFYFLF